MSERAAKATAEAVREADYANQRLSTRHFEENFEAAA